MFRLFALAVCDVAVGTLAWSGLMKLFDPRSFASATSSLRLTGTRRVPALAARGVGVGELALAATVLVIGSPGVLVALAGAYLVFALVSARAIVVGAESCGCFGQRSVRPTWTHVALNASVAVVAMVAAGSVSERASLVERLDPSVPVATTYLAFSVLGTALLVGALTRAERLIPVVAPVRRTRP